MKSNVIALFNQIAPIVKLSNDIDDKIGRGVKNTLFPIVNSK